MAWKEVLVMEERCGFVLLAEKRQQSFSSLCTEYGVSRKTGYKWLERYRKYGLKALSELSRRTSRTVAGGGDPGSTNTEFFIYDGNQVVADVSTNGVVLRTYVWGPGIDNLLSLTTYDEETNTYYAVKDHLNSVHALVDEVGAIVERYEYDAWGRTTVFDSAGTQLTGSSVGNRYCFQGREIDRTTGLYYFRARWYDPVVGRWLSNDPIGISGGLNMYAFCGNNPVNAVDPMGNFGYWFGDHDGVTDIGRRGTPISDQPGQAGEILEKYLPAGETFGQSHDAFVGFMVPELGDGKIATGIEWVIDGFVNVPTMPIMYGGAVVAETARSVVEAIGGVYNFFTGGGNSCGGKK